MSRTVKKSRFDGISSSGGLQALDGLNVHGREHRIGTAKGLKELQAGGKGRNGFDKTNSLEIKSGLPYLTQSKSIRILQKRQLLAVSLQIGQG